MKLEEYKKAGDVPTDFKNKLEQFDKNLFCVRNDVCGSWDIFEFIGEGRKPQAIIRIDELDGRVFQLLERLRIKENPDRVSAIIDEIDKQVDMGTTDCIEVENKMQADFSKYVLRGHQSFSLNPNGLYLS